MISINNFINGEFVPPNSNQYLDVYEPATGLIYSNVADSNSNDVENAYQSAQSAFKFWSGISVEERAAEKSGKHRTGIQDKRIGPIPQRPPTRGHYAEFRGRCGG